MSSCSWSENVDESRVCIASFSAASRAGEESSVSGGSCKAAVVSLVSTAEFEGGKGRVFSPPSRLFSSSGAAGGDG